MRLCVMALRQERNIYRNPALRVFRAPPGAQYLEWATVALQNLFRKRKNMIGTEVLASRSVKSEISIEPIQ